MARRDGRRRLLQVLSTIVFITAASGGMSCGGLVEVDAECGARESSVAEAHSVQCGRELPVTLEPEPHVPCRVFRVLPAKSTLCSCDAPGYSPVTDVDGLLYRSLYDRARCGSDRCCKSLCFCELQQYQGEMLARCLNDPYPPTKPAGWCYISPAQGVGSYAAMQNDVCDHELRFVSPDERIEAILMCQS